MKKNTVKVLQANAHFGLLRFVQLGCTGYNFKKLFFGRRSISMNLLCSQIRKWLSCIWVQSFDYGWTLAEAFTYGAFSSDHR